MDTSNTVFKNTQTHPSGIAGEKDMNIAMLIESLTLYGGAIVCTASLSIDQISDARVEGRMVVMDDGIGLVWIPKNKILDWAINDKQE